MFPSPDRFKPERFLAATDPRMKAFELPFGFGRRICPGMHLASNSLFINIARLLWAFDILPVLNEDGKEIVPGTGNLIGKERALLSSLQTHGTSRTDLIRAP